MSNLVNSVPDTTTFAANIVVFLAAVAAAAVGALQAVKKIKEAFVEGKEVGGSGKDLVSTQVVGGMLQDAFSSAMLAESIRNMARQSEGVREAVDDLTKEMREHRVLLQRILDRMDDRRH